MTTPNRLVLASVKDVPLDDVIAVHVAGHDIALYNVDGTFYASRDLCNHGNARLSDGFLDGDVIECPLHGGCFNVVSGEPCAPPVTHAMVTYSVAVVDDQVVLTAPEELEFENVE
jgi:naphthalene 1,2-dioxygenase system ferredoxin subunit